MIGVDTSHYAGSATTGKARGRSAFLCGFFGALNVGDEAVCRAVVECLRSVGITRLTLVTRDAAVTREFAQVDADDYIEGLFYPFQPFWRNLAHYVRSLVHSERIIIGGGGLLQDSHSWITIPTFLLPAALGQALGRPVITVGLGVGPIRRPWLRRMVRGVCRHVSAIQVRDAHSRDVLIDCGVSASRMSVTADVVPALELETGCTREQTPGTPLRRIGFAVRRWEGIHEAGLVGLWERLAQEGCELHLLTYEPAADRAYYEALLGRCSARCTARATIHVPRSLDDAVGAVSHVDALIAMRLHACVFAAMLGVPLLGLPYDDKVRAFMEAVGLADCLRPLADVTPEWAQDLTDVARSAPRRAAETQQRLAAMRQRARENFTVAAQTEGHRHPHPAARWSGLFWSLCILALGFGWGLGAATVRAGRRLCDLLPFSSTRRPVCPSQ